MTVQGQETERAECKPVQGGRQGEYRGMGGSLLRGGRTQARALPDGLGQEVS